MVYVSTDLKNIKYLAIHSIFPCSPETAFTPFYPGFGHFSWSVQELMAKEWIAVKKAVDVNN